MIQIQLLLKLNFLHKTDMLTCYHSNTTLVKVKLASKEAGNSNFANSNTTLVKVKSSHVNYKIQDNEYSNTTLVKVKYT